MSKGNIIPLRETLAWRQRLAILAVESWDGSQKWSWLTHPPPRAAAAPPGILRFCRGREYRRIIGNHCHTTSSMQIIIQDLAWSSPQPGSGVLFVPAQHFNKSVLIILEVVSVGTFTGHACVLIHCRNHVFHSSLQ